MERSANRDYPYINIGDGKEDNQMQDAKGIELWRSHEIAYIAGAKGERRKGKAYRFFFIDSEDTLIKVSGKVFDGIYSNDEPSCAVPELANQKVRFVVAVYDLEGRRPILDSGFLFCGFIEFDERGKGSEEDLHRKMGLLMNFPKRYRDECFWTLDERMVDAIVLAETIASVDRIEKRQIDEAIARLENLDGGKKEEKAMPKMKNVTVTLQIRTDLSVADFRDEKKWQKTIDLTQKAAGNSTNTCTVLRADAIVAPARLENPSQQDEDSAEDGNSKE